MEEPFSPSAAPCCLCGHPDVGHCLPARPPSCPPAYLIDIRYGDFREAYEHKLFIKLSEGIYEQLRTLSQKQQQQEQSKGQHLEANRREPDSKDNEPLESPRGQRKRSRGHEEDHEFESGRSAKRVKSVLTQALGARQHAPKRARRRLKEMEDPWQALPVAELPVEHAGSPQPQCASSSLCLPAHEPEPEHTYPGRQPNEHGYEPLHSTTATDPDTPQLDVLPLPHQSYDHTTCLQQHISHPISPPETPPIQSKDACGKEDIYGGWVGRVKYRELISWDPV